jgi:hypothetical protein
MQNKKLNLESTFQGVNRNQFNYIYTLITRYWKKILSILIVFLLLLDLMFLPEFIITLTCSKNLKILEGGEADFRVMLLLFIFDFLALFLVVCISMSILFLLAFKKDLNGENNKELNFVDITIYIIFGVSIPVCILIASFIIQIEIMFSNSTIPMLLLTFIFLITIITSWFSIFIGNRILILVYKKNRA